MGLLELLVVVCEATVCRLGSDYGVQRLRPVFLGSAPCTGDFDAIGELFSGGPLSLREDSPGRTKLLDSTLG
ncbi:hypothetical protein Bca52824_089018 [Brassica carinata]|uniref:Uncharacterized protein n=1 Tax=Brassica carinata TaxID=52824 RepID=A0A8X7TP70_BRACI|nr:hypothetical protein Bca52824_089018 [Brassica carinata]